MFRTSPKIKLSDEKTTIRKTMIHSRNPIFLSAINIIRVTYACMLKSLCWTWLIFTNFSTLLIPSNFSILELYFSAYLSMFSSFPFIHCSTFLSIQFSCLSHLLPLSFSSLIIKYCTLYKETFYVGTKSSMTEKIFASNRKHFKIKFKQIQRFGWKHMCDTNIF